MIAEKKLQNISAIGNPDASSHVTGKSIYVDDIPAMEGLLFIKPFDSPNAHGIIKKLDFPLQHKWKVL